MSLETTIIEMWEIDTLLTSSIQLIKDSKLNFDNKNNMIWNLENIPAEYDFDAGNYEKSDLIDGFDYKKMNPYELGKLIIIEAKTVHTTHLIYDWSAFLLNFWSEYFSKIDELNSLKSNYLEHIKIIFSKIDFTDYKPIHSTLTIYKGGNKWFSEEQNELIKWYCS